MSVASTDTLATMADFDLDSTGESGKLTLPPELVSAVLADAIGKAIHACIQDATASQKMFDYATFLEYWNDAIANLLGASRLFRSVVLEIIAAIVGLDCRDDCLMSVTTRPQNGPPFSFYVYERLRSLVLFGISSRRGSLQPPPVCTSPLMVAYAHYLTLKFTSGILSYSNTSLVRRALCLENSGQPVCVQVFGLFVKALDECENVPEETKQYLWKAGMDVKRFYYTAW